MDFHKQSSWGLSRVFGLRLDLSENQDPWEDLHKGLLCSSFLSLLWFSGRGL